MVTTPARHRLLRITRYPQYRAPGVRSELALMCAGTDVAIDLVDGVDGVLASVSELLDRDERRSERPIRNREGYSYWRKDRLVSPEAAAVLLRLSGVAKTAALALDELGRKVTAPELADVPVMERAVAT